MRCCNYMEISVPIDVKNFIDHEVSKPVRSRIIPIVQQAYDLVGVALNEVSFLNWDIGGRHVGYLDHIAVQFSLYEAVKKGILNNITAQIVPNVNKSAYHVEL